MVQIAEWLGGEKVLHFNVRNDMDLNRIILAGIPVAAVSEVARRAQLNQSEVERIVSRRTLGRLKDGMKRLTPELSDRLIRYTRILLLAEETFESRDNALVWMRRPNRALGGSIPLEMLETDNGARMVEQVLGRMAHGVFS